MKESGSHYADSKDMKIACRGIETERHFISVNNTYIC
jgi:hypothetical protein